MKRFSIFALAAVAMFVGCTKDFDTDVKVDDGIVRGELVEMSLVFEDTRVERDGVSGKLSWSKGDQIAVVLSNEGTYTLDTEKYTVNHETGKVTIPSNTAYAIYPANIINEVTEAGVATLNFWQTHSARIGHSNSNFTKPEDIFQNNPMKGVVSGTTLAFTNLMGYLKVPLTGEGTLKSVTIKNNNGCVNGFKGLSRIAEYDLTATSATLDMSTWEASRSYVKVEFKNGLDLSTSPAIYVPVPANEYDNMALVIETGTGANTIYAKNSHKVNRSAIKPVSATAINVTASTPATPESLNGTTGDSKMDYANTYIVPNTAGEYSFKAKLANGDELKGGVTAEIVWAEEAGLFNNFHYDPETNTISFKSNGKEGNALVALSKNNNSDDTIVWTWLLWCTDKPQVITVNNESKDFKVLDRVIGATWAPTTMFTDKSSELGGAKNDYALTKGVTGAQASEACGLYYQYQNMIPYPRIKDTNGVDEYAAGNEGKNTRMAISYGFHKNCQIWRDSSSGAGEVYIDDNEQFRTNASRYPLCMYRVNANDNGWINSLIDGSTNSFSNTFDAGEGKTGYRLWGGTNAQAINSAYKTNNDPCPAGYMIDNNNGTYYYCLGGNKVSTKGFVCTENAETYNYGDKLYAFYLSGKNESNNAVALYFPMASFRAKCKVKPTRNEGYIYTYKNYQTGNLFTTEDGYTQYYGSSLQYGVKNENELYINRNQGKQNHAQAYNVRCRKFGN